VDNEKREEQGPEQFKCPNCGEEVDPRLREIITEAVNEAILKMKDPPPAVIRRYRLTGEKLSETKRVKSFDEAQAYIRRFATSSGDYLVRSQNFCVGDGVAWLDIEVLWRNGEAMEKGLQLFGMTLPEIAGGSNETP